MKIQNSEIRKIFSIVGLGVFSSMIILELRQRILEFGDPILIGVIGLLISAYIFRIK